MPHYKFLPPHGVIPFRTVCPTGPEFTALNLLGLAQARTYSCGYACVLMVLRYYCGKVSKQELFDHLHTDKEGTSQNALVKGLRAYGVSANIRYDFDWGRLRTEINRGKLVIGYDNLHEHWLVMYGYGIEPERVLIADPDCYLPPICYWDKISGRLGNFGIVCNRREEKQCIG